MNTVGYTLKSSRISQQLTLDYVSSELKISKSTLQELENDEIKLNADIVFIIGHLRTYSNFLNLETNKLINQFKSEISYNQNNYSDEIVKPSITVEATNVERDKLLFRLISTVPMMAKIQHWKLMSEPHNYHLI